MVLVHQTPPSPSGTTPASMSAGNSLASGSASGALPPGSPAPASPPSAVQTRSAVQDRPAIDKPLRSRSPSSKLARISEAQLMETQRDDDLTQDYASNPKLLTPAAPTPLGVHSQGSLGSFPAGQPDTFPSSPPEAPKVYGLGSIASPLSPAPFPLPPASALRGRAGLIPPSPSTGGESPDFDFLVSEALKTTVLRLVDSQKATILDTVSSTLKNNNKIVGDQCHTICTTACAKANEAIIQRLDSLEGSVNNIGDDNAKLHIKIDDLTEKLDKALSSLGHSNSLPNLEAAAQNHIGNPDAAPPMQSVTTPLFHRTPDPTKLYVNIHNRAFVPITSFNTAFEKLAADCGQDPNLFEVTGEVLDNRFDIQYIGPKGAATGHCLTLFQSLYLGRGKHEGTRCLDEKNNYHKFYINPDRNGAQIRREILSKEVAKILQSAFPSHTFFVQKSTGSVYWQRQVLGTVVVIDPVTSRVSWKPAARIGLGLIDEVLANVDDEFSKITGGVSRP